ncbi:MAG: sigma-70 family RNA polymerase sigma factor [Acidobacteria bacterium]|nr:sigma-70 family RNA polymerase sigma factor [Acidobacteriota bacterium]
MPDSTDTAVTALLQRVRDGDGAAREAMVPLVYDELRRLAASYLRHERPNHTLQPTALVHEAYMRLVDQRDVAWQNRAHFMAVAAIVMRRVLVNHARDRAAAKRGDGVVPESLSVLGDVAGPAPLDVLALDLALDALTALDARKGQVVELKFFGGLTTPEVAEALGASVATVERDWSFARAWRFHRLSQ